MTTTPVVRRRPGPPGAALLLLTLVSAGLWAQDAVPTAAPAVAAPTAQPLALEPYQPPQPANLGGSPTMLLLRGIMSR